MVNLRTRHLGKVPMCFPSFFPPQNLDSEMGTLKDMGFVASNQKKVTGVTFIFLEDHSVDGNQKSCVHQLIWQRVYPIIYKRFIYIPAI